MVRKDQKYRAGKDVEVIYLTSWAAPCTGGTKGVLPQREVFAIAYDPLPTATAAYADPQSYAELERQFVSQADRENPKYRGFHLSIRLTDIERSCHLCDSAQIT